MTRTRTHTRTRESPHLRRAAGLRREEDAVEADGAPVGPYYALRASKGKQVLDPKKCITKNILYIVGWLVIGDEGHRCYADEAWPVMLKEIENIQRKKASSRRPKGRA